MLSKTYIDEVKSRSFLKYCLGLIPRTYNFCKNIIIISICRFRGANVDYSSYVTLKLALKANKNLNIGKRCLIDTNFIDLREKVIIHNDIIINNNVNIIRQSHDFNDINFKLIGNSLEIHSWAWIASESLILPGCKSIGEGSIVAAGAVITKDLQKMEIFAGNPAKKIKERISLPLDLYLPKYHGLDLKAYFTAKFK